MIATFPAAAKRTQVTGLPVGPEASAHFVIADAGESTFPDWHGYNVCFSTDGETWARVAGTAFDPAAGLRWTLAAPTASCAWFAYFPPYSLERQLGLVARAQASGLCRHAVLGRSGEGRDLHALAFGRGPRAVWVQHRQHPGEVRRQGGAGHAAFQPRRPTL